MDNGIYVPRQNEVLKPFEAFIYLDEGTLDKDGHPIVCLAYMIDMSRAIVFHFTSEPQSTKEVLTDFLYYIPHKKDGDIKYTNSDDKDPYIDLTQFSVITFKQANHSDKFYGTISDKTIQDILAQHLFLWDNGMVLGEELLEQIPQFQQKVEHTLRQYSFLNSYEERDLLYTYAYLNQVDSTNTERDFVDVSVLYDYYRNTERYKELEKLKNSSKYSELFRYYYQFLHNSLSRILIQHDEADRKKLVLWEGDNDEIVWYPLIKRDFPSSNNSNPSIYTFPSGEVFDECFYSRCAYLVDPSTIYISNKESFYQKNPGLVIHYDQAADSSIVKNNLLTRSLYLMDHGKGNISISYQPEDGVNHAFLQNPNYWMMNIMLSVNQFSSEFSSLDYDIREDYRNSKLYDMFSENSTCELLEEFPSTEVLEEYPMEVSERMGRGR